MNINNFIAILFVLLCTTCTSHTTNKTNEEKWSVKLADAVIARNDSLAIYNNPSSIKWKFDLAMLGQAISNVGNGDDIYSSYYENYIDLFVQGNGRILTYKQNDFNLDNVYPAKSLLSLYQKTKNDKYRLAIETILEQLKNQPKVENGGYCHKAIYTNQIWLNSMYMLDPFLAQYAHDFCQYQWFDTICLQLQNTYQSTLDIGDGLLYHAWDSSKKQSWADPQTGLSPNKWCRGMGWYMMALVDVLEYLPIDHPQRKTINKILLDTSKALLNVRDNETGLWFQILNQGDREFNYIETSGSAMFIYAFAKGVNLGVLPSNYQIVALESFNELIGKHIKTDIDNLPTLMHISGSAGLGVKMHRDGSFEYYINQKQVDNDPKGMAPLIMAALELNL